METLRTLSEPKSYTDLEYAVMYKSRCEKLETELADARAEIERLKTELREISDSCSKSNLDVEMMAMLKRTTLAIKYITDGTIQSNSMLNVLLIESAELIKKMEA